MTLENSKQLSASSLRLPACRISESVQQLMELALNTLCEAVGSSTQWYVKSLRNPRFTNEYINLLICVSRLFSALQLFFTVRNIFQLFYDVVPTYHK